MPGSLARKLHLPLREGVIRGCSLEDQANDQRRVPGSIMPTMAGVKTEGDSEVRSPTSGSTPDLRKEKTPKGLLAGLIAFVVQRSPVLISTDSSGRVYCAGHERNP